MEPPDNVKESCPNWESVALQHLEDVSVDTISMHFIDGGKDKGQGSFTHTWDDLQNETLIGFIDSLSLMT